MPVRLLPQSFTTMAAVEMSFRKMRARPSVPANTVWREFPFCMAAAEKNGGTLSPAFRPARTPVKKLRVGLKKAANDEVGSICHGSSLDRHCIAGGVVVP